MEYIGEGIFSAAVLPFVAKTLFLKGLFFCQNFTLFKEEIWWTKLFELKI